MKTKMSIAMSTNHNHNHHRLCIRRIEIWTRVWQATMVALIIAVGVSLGYKIRIQRAEWIKNSKAIDVYAEGIQLSHSAVVILGKDGTVLKSNHFADEMFSGPGHNIEGTNIHDFCVSPEARQRGADGLVRWFASAKDGARMSLLVTAKTPIGSKDIAIMVTTLKPTAGSDVKAVATINYADCFEIHDFRIHNENQ